MAIKFSSKAIAMANVQIIFVFVLAAFKLSWGFTNTLEATLKMGRVVGGTNVADNRASFIVSFQQSGIHYCAGSIHSKNWVLTAAHCLGSKTQVKNTILVAGNINVAGSTATTQKRSIDYYVANDLYLGDTSPYDIGLVYTKTPFKLSNDVSVITLPSSGSTPSGNAFLYGWGSTSKTHKTVYPSTLQVAIVPLIPLNTCKLALGSKGADLHDTNICTGPLTGGVGICTSDSGGPLIQNVKGNPVLVGIVSWGKLPCGQPNSPSVFAKVSSFLSWIENNQLIPK